MSLFGEDDVGTPSVAVVLQIFRYHVDAMIIGDPIYHACYKWAPVNLAYSTKT